MTGKREKTAALSKGRQQGGLQKAALYFWKHKYLYLMLLPAILYYIIFCYVPMYGVTIAFKDFNPMLGIWKSPWAGTEMFQKLFGMEKFYSVFWNTIRISLIRLIFGFPFPIIIALLLNELRLGKVKRVIQTAIYIPNFISWVVLGGILTSLLSMDSGIVNGVIKALGFAPIGFLTDEKYFVGTMVVSMIWKTFGWNTIIYLAAITGIDPQLYEAATVDGANRWQKLLHITLPCIRSIIIVVLITRIGGLMQAGFEQIFVLYHPGVYGTADIIDTYVYRMGLQEGKFELATAVGLFKSVINFALVVIANKTARMAGEEKPKKIKVSVGSRIFDTVNLIFLILLGLTTFYPFWDCLVVSFSSLKSYLATNIHLWPDEWSFEGYAYMLKSFDLWRSYANSIFITVVGTLINMLITTMAAYVLSKKDLKGQRFFMFLAVFTMMFTGGIIPTYIVVKDLHLMNSLWAMILPSAVNTYNLIILRNFFLELPMELEEAALLDGCTEIGVLFRIMLPISKPALTTVTLFYAVDHWNDFFSAIMYINKKEAWPLQLFLRSMLFQNDAAYSSGGESLFLLGQPMKMAAVMLAIIPIMCAYPFFQKYFTAGMTAGAVKG